MVALARGPDKQKKGESPGPPPPQTLPFSTPRMRVCLPARAGCQGPGSSTDPATAATASNDVVPAGAFSEQIPAAAPDLAQARRDHVHVFLVNGVDPLNYGDMAGLGDHIRQLGFA